MRESRLSGSVATHRGCLYNAPRGLTSAEISFVSDFDPNFSLLAIVCGRRGYRRIIIVGLGSGTDPPHAAATRSRSRSRSIAEPAAWRVGPAAWPDSSHPTQ